VSAVEFSPVDRNLIASAAADGGVRLWDATTGLTLASLEDYQGWEALYLCYSADGRKLLTTGSSGEAVIWDLRSFDQHIAWNCEFQIQTRAAELGADLKADQARAVTTAGLAAARAPLPPAEPLAVTPAMIEAWAAPNR
jgi:WD40 repeat protein